MASIKNNPLHLANATIFDLGAVKSKGFFAEHMLARTKTQHGIFEVGGMGCGDINHVNIWIGH